jgi:hypothetical protein
MIPVLAIFLMPNRFQQTDDGGQFALVAGHLDGVVLLADVHHLAPEDIDDPQDLGAVLGDLAVTLMRAISR